MSVPRPVHRPIRLGAVVLVGLVIATQLTVAVAPAVSATPSASDDQPASKLVLVLDSSGSMKEPNRSETTKIAAAKRALRAVVDKLPATANVGIAMASASRSMSSA